VPESVLDASAILALLNSEPGSDVVSEALPGSVISALNLSEVVAKLEETGMPEKEIRRVLYPLGLDVESFDEDQAYRAGVLRSSTTNLRLSLGDRGCLGLAQKLGLPALTADKRWLQLSVGVTVRTIR
jgi:ribonuclease VapC